MRAAISPTDDTSIFPPDGRVQNIWPVNLQARRGIPRRSRTHLATASLHASIFRLAGSVVVSGHGGHRHIVARWLIKFRALMPAPYEIRAVIRDGRPYSSPRLCTGAWRRESTPDPWSNYPRSSYEMGSIRFTLIRLMNAWYRMPA